MGILKNKARLVLYTVRAMAGLYDKAMIDILQKLEKGRWGSRVALNAPCANMKSINIQTNA